MSNAFTSYREPARDITVIEETDVIVAGAGPAGVTAAISAARHGARVRLIESAGCLGGVWTAGLLSWILDKDNKPGLMQEILARLDALGGRAHDNAYDAEVMKRVLEEMCDEAGVEVRLLTTIVSAARDVSANRIACVITESKSGREAWAARMYIDCTGDGDLAARAGCGFDVGREGTGDTQPVSLLCLITGVDFEVLNARGVCRGRDVKPHVAKMNFLKELEGYGIHPSYTSPALFPIRNDLFGVLINHVYGVRADNAQALSDATRKARRELHSLFDALRATGGVWQNVRIATTAERLGVREGRRVHGQYTVTTQDMVDGRRHEDAVCRVTFPIDVHSTDPSRGKAFEKVDIKIQHYDIPMRALIAKDIDGLLMAGRCVSGDFIAHSSYRVTGNAVAMGEAAGRYAALQCVGEAVL
ncbi:FAD-dependent oxidoreductase [Verrucomicrobia bacterium LW23]|nr:FAD-dependent oxidoreductase [Verrucomicrobia bacterium LW23]